jgi:alkylation response protein AidB-like acyl-CoA dehydrogenase
MASRVIPEMVQVMGGYGTLKETGVEKLYRDIKMMCIADGTVERVAMYAADRL